MPTPMELFDRLRARRGSPYPAAPRPQVSSAPYHSTALNCTSFARSSPALANCLPVNLRKSVSTASLRTHTADVPGDRDVTSPRSARVSRPLLLTSRLVATALGSHPFGHQG